MTAQVNVSTIVLEGKQILKECRAFRKEKGNDISEADMEELHKKMIKEHDKFASVYIIPLRTIVYSNVYYDQVMERFVKFLMNNPWKTRKEFMERQGEYMIYLYRAMHPRHGSSEVAKYREKVMRELAEDNKRWDEYEKEVKAKVDAERKEIIDDRRTRLFEALKEKAAASS